ncbi:MAG: hypothetical protein CMD92_03590 [Gammaproteobacteria bacterium]|nr:hypothetical protein [Gammaproteobacteria bacterium]|tara:strand:- start:4813 stop:5652 length:840 start_codon:yes stop_codon:yes gene_type:complete
MQQVAKRARPQPLAELCHDALAKGVIAQHDGLPESWIKLFGNNGNVMKQLRELVVRPGDNAREARLCKSSLIGIKAAVPMPDSRTKYRDQYFWEHWQVPAERLPKWLFKLLEAYFEGLYYTDSDIITNASQQLFEGWQIDWSTGVEEMFEDLYGWSKLWDDERGEIYHTLVHTLIQAFDVDVLMEYNDEIEADPEWRDVLNEDVTEETLFMIVDEFQHKTHDILVKEIRARVQGEEEDGKEAMLENLAENPEASIHRTIFRTSFATLAIDGCPNCVNRD